MEEPSIGEKLLLAGLETCDKVGEERITLACRLLHLVPAQAVYVGRCLIFECQWLSWWLLSGCDNDKNDDDDILTCACSPALADARKPAPEVFASTSDDYKGQK